MSTEPEHKNHTDQTRSDHTYIERTEKSGGTGALAFIVGALVIAVGVLAFTFYEDTPSGTASTGSDVNISVEDGDSAAAEDAANAVEGAANAVEGAAEETSQAVTDAANAVEGAAESDTQTN